MCRKNMNKLRSVDYGLLREGAVLKTNSFGSIKLLNQPPSQEVQDLMTLDFHYKQMCLFIIVSKQILQWKCNLLCLL